MQTINKNLVIVILPIDEIVFCFMWISKIKELTTSVTSTQTRIEQEDLSVKDWGSDLYAWQQLKYALTTNISCSRTTYKQDNSTIWIELDRCDKTFYRCNLKCRDIYKADFKTTRATTNIQGVSPMDTQIKVLSDRKNNEISTIGLNFLVSSRICIATPLLIHPNFAKKEIQNAQMLKNAKIGPLR